jgi:hypothetical protein
MFVSASVVLVVALLRTAAASTALAALLLLTSLVLQGHRAEQHAPAPFTSPLNPVVRILCEQWLTFPRYVRSGRWARGSRGATGSRLT